MAWGIVPNNESILRVTPESLAERLRDGIRLISDKAGGAG